MKASDLTTAHEVWACADTDDARHVAIAMRDHNVKSLPVLDDQGRLEGIVTERDLVVRLLARGRSFETPVHNLMSRPVKTIGMDTPLEEIEAIMREHKVRHLPVTDENNRLKGFVSISDLIRQCKNTDQEHELISVIEATHAPGKPSSQ
ncbi:MAG: CBS domain-containing protein [Planctomycetota bacterium]